MPTLPTLLLTSLCLSALWLPTTASAHGSTGGMTRTSNTETAPTVEELQQLLQQLDPALVEQLYQSLSDTTEQLGNEADNYLRCLEAQQAINPAQPLDLSSFITEALTSGKACQFLLDDIIKQLQQRPADSEIEKNNQQLLDQSL